jgi:hypothetical protein
MKEIERTHLDDPSKREDKQKRVGYEIGKKYNYSISREEEGGKKEHTPQYYPNKRAGSDHSRSMPVQALWSKWLSQ